MNRTLLALWAIIFGSILAIVALVVVWTRQQEAQVKLNLAGLLRAQLDGYNRDLHQLFEQYDRELQQALDGFDPQVPGAVLDLERHPLAGLVVIVSDDGLKGRLRHPAPEQIEPMDRSLIDDAVNWIRDNNFTNQSAANSLPQQAAIPAQAKLPAQRSVVQAPTSSSVSGLKSRNSEAASSRNTFLAQTDSHWTTWYHGRGLVLAYWAQSAQQTVTMIIVPRGRWLSDLVAVLPDNTQSRADALVQLVDVEGATISQWGNLQLVGSQVIDAEMAVEDPLEGWRLRLMLTPEARNAALGLQNRWLSGLVASGFSLALILLGVILSINIQRQLNLARQQVSFVNQVSHELRTPLTNIRMYTDLALHGLEAHRDLGLEHEIERLAVIQQESTRLGRLIENVLTFARSGKPRPLRASRMENVELLIDTVLSAFAPQLSEHQMVVERSARDPQSLMVDREALEQILINLISNAIKYAASGHYLRIETEYDSHFLQFSVIDRGPGIPRRMWERVFKPFVRGSNRLEDPAGTGIGLSIARQLARQHGGDCWLEPSSPSGTTFKVKIQALNG